MRPRLMMVGGFAEAYRAAVACGFELTVVQNRTDLTPEDIALLDRLITSPINAPIVVDLAETLHRAEPFAAVVSFQEHGVLNAALIQQRLGVPGNPLRPVELTRDKGRMREHLRERGLATVEHLTTTSADEVRAFGEKVGWPVILKPIGGSASRQVHRLGGPGEVTAALADNLAVNPGLPVIVEAFAVGPEVSVEAVSWEGRHRVLAVTDKLTTGAPHYVETGHTMPSRLPGERIAAAEQATVDFLDSIGHRYGPSHTEVIVTADGPVIVESHTRTGGDRIFELVELVTGVDMFAAVLAGFAGAFPDHVLAGPPPRGAQGGAAIRYFDVGAGTVGAVHGLAQAERSPGVLRVESGLAVGKDVPPLRMSHDRQGYVLAVGASAEEAAERAAAAVRLIRVDLV
ncbi:biotin carboxylase [Kitasatospora sp. MAP12-15]|uniref:ATP-grasp domain-containing protein n=1 Tax=unclassified Kitasatospora TaxID=2633591 RepID=UPI002476155C|nr:ATP-grasp domain-containing protein [Kitasatospora sp. MAP12-44]MDH6114800.1 biotin carboxylase [Kitasatospora sp. MAP12-44]